MIEVVLSMTCLEHSTSSDRGVGIPWYEVEPAILALGDAKSDEAFAKIASVQAEGLLRTVV